MRQRMIIIAVGAVLAGLGLPALPAAAAAGTTCANVTMYDSDPQPDDVLARTCIAWDDKPDGKRWTHYQSKVWNPPGTGPTVISARFYSNTGSWDGETYRIADGHTLVRWMNTTGEYTAKFMVYGITAAMGPYRACKYMIPRDHSETKGYC